MLELHVRVDREEILLLVGPVLVGVALPVKPVAAHFRSDQHVGARTIVCSEAHRIETAWERSDNEVAAIRVAADAGARQRWHTFDSTDQVRIPSLSKAMMLVVTPCGHHGPACPAR